MARLTAALVSGVVMAAAPIDVEAAPPPPLPLFGLHAQPSTYRGHPAGYWAQRYRRRTRQLQAVRAELRHRWQPTVSYALRLASAVSGVPYTDLSAVAWCESTHNPFAVNGRYHGLFQLGWAPFGMSAFDPVANAISAALTVRHDGGWRQWECKP